MSFVSRTLLFVCTIFFAALPVCGFDLNNDGNEDIVFCNYCCDDSYNLNSFIYFGDGKGNFRLGFELATHGARGCAVSDLNNDGNYDLIIANYSNGESRKINSYIYWGKDFKRVSELPTVSGYGVSVSDFNKDGYKDIVFSNYSDGDHADINSYVYWGDPEYKYETKTELPTHGALGNSVDDFNNDGYPDILFCNHNNEEIKAKSIIYFGSKDEPFKNKTQIDTGYPYDSTVADLNNDGYPDIVFSYFSDGNSFIFWGSKKMDYSQKTELKTDFATCNSVSDLDNDGYLDIIFSCYKNGDNYNINSYVYWGNSKNQYSERTQLPTRGAHGNSIADLNNDGNLDIIFSNHHDVNSIIYWGNGSRKYDKQTSIKTFGATAVSTGNISSYGQNK